MKVTKIIQHVNTLFNNADLEYADLELFLDQSIDWLNENLGTDFPLISEYEFDARINFDIDYDSLPDTWIRNFVIPFVVSKRFQQEGLAYQDFELEYNKWFQTLTHTYQIPPRATKIVREAGKPYTAWIDGRVYVVGTWNPEKNQDVPTWSQGGTWRQNDVTTSMDGIFPVVGDDLNG